MRGAAIALVLLSACTSPADMHSAVESMGFTDVVMLDDYPWFACGDDDWMNGPFRATNAAGKRVKGVICCGMATKVCTVRF
jgi:hypothetical protein